MSESEIKLLSVKCSLQADIMEAKSMILYAITNEAKGCRELLQDLPSVDGTRTLSKDDYDFIWGYLRRVDQNLMHGGKDKEYLRKYYEEIDIKEKILNKL